MKKNILFAVGFALISGVSAQSFSCDANAVKGDFGIEPTTLPNAYVSHAYSEVLTFKAPADAKKIPMVETIVDSIINLLPPGTIPTGGTINIELSKYKIEDIIGLPTGFGHTCNKTNCLYSGGDLGCLKIEGTPTEVGTYDLKVNMYVDVKAKIMLGPIPIYTEQFDTTIVVPGTYKFVVKPADEKPKNVSIEDHSAYQVALYPNPAQKNIMLNNVSEYDTYKIYDTNGRLIVNGKLKEDQTTINVEQLNDGIYFVNISDSSGVHSLKSLKLTIKN